MGRKEVGEIVADTFKARNTMQEWIAFYRNYTPGTLYRELCAIERDCKSDGYKVIPHHARLQFMACAKCWVDMKCGLMVKGVKTVFDGVD